MKGIPARLSIDKFEVFSKENDYLIHFTHLFSEISCFVASNLKSLISSKKNELKDALDKSLMRKMKKMISKFKFIQSSLNFSCSSMIKQTCAK